MKKDIVIFDLDGTLALIDHRLPLISGTEKDWDAFFRACEADPPYEAVCAMARALLLNGYKLWIVSGRSDAVRHQTVAWLEAHHIAADRIIMRAEGDRTTDFQLKRQWATDGTLPLERVMCVFEDRQAVVDMWRELGLPCFQVQSGT